MGRILTLFLIVSMPFLGLSQYRYDFGGSLGVSNYLGEISGSSKKDKSPLGDIISLDQTKVAIGVFGRMKVHPLLSVKVGLNNFNIAGADSLSGNFFRRARNLSFKNNITELSARAEFYYFEINDIGNSYKARDDLRFYLFGGFGAFYHNPKAFYEGEWYSLQPLKTEGENNVYSHFSVSIPAGGGFIYSMGKKYSIGWEMGVNKTFTDYLDDASSVYGDPSKFIGNDIDKEMNAILSNRTVELLSDPKVSEIQSNYGYLYNGGKGNPRGGKAKDYIIFSNVNISYVMRGKSSFYKSRYNTMFSGKKYSKSRKTRAKF